MPEQWKLQFVPYDRQVGNVLLKQRTKCLNNWQNINQQSCGYNKQCWSCEPPNSNSCSIRTLFIFQGHDKWIIVLEYHPDACLHRQPLTDEGSTTCLTFLCISCWISFSFYIARLNFNRICRWCLFSLYTVQDNQCPYLPVRQQG